ncbi:MAG: TrkH family potassium uptake protein [Planctomycetota bacterium]|jgi:trk system potassium uptake protein TrkH
MISPEPPSRTPPRRIALMGCDVVLAVAAAVAVAALLLEHGFYEPPVEVGVLHVIQVCALAGFMLDRVVRLLLSPRRKRYLKENWIDYALIAAAAGAAVAWPQVKTPALSAAAMYVVITQVYILSVLVTRVVGFQVRVAGTGVHPIWMLIGSFAGVILFGTGLLMLPRAAPDPAGDPVTFTDALFTATSATCVTGLLVRDTAERYAPFGHAVIGAMIQLGGLGIMLFGTVFAVLTRRALSGPEPLQAGRALSEGTIGRIGRMAKLVVLATLGVELAGALVMLPMWLDVAGGDGPVRGVLHSLFHSVSAFCNAGFALRSDNLVDLRERWQVAGVIAPLIFLGGLGFPVLYDLVDVGWRGLKRLAGLGRGAAAPLTLHSKLVLATSAALLIVGAGGLMLIEWAADPGQTYGARFTDTQNPRAVATVRPALSRLGVGEQVREAAFQSVTARTAGFNTVDVDALSDAGKFWMCLLMFVGGSPASTAGGIKTVTLAAILLSTWSVLRRRERAAGFGRTIAESFVRKAVLLAGAYAALVVIATLGLAIAMKGKPLPTGRPATFVQLLFEVCSACGTVGLSCGVTGALTTFGKYVIIAAMFIGRLGPLALLLALTAGVRPARIAYPDEDVVLG